MLYKTDIENLNYLSSRLNPKQAAKYLGKSPKTLAYWRTKNLGPEYIKTRGKVYYFQKLLNSWSEKDT